MKNDRPQTPAEQIIDDLVEEHPKQFKEAEYKSELIQWFVNEAMKRNRSITPLAYSLALRRKLDNA